MSSESIPEKIVQAGAEAQVVMYRCAYRDDEGQTAQQDDTYAVFTCHRIPCTPYDDGTHSVEWIIMIHLYSRWDPTTTEEALENALIGQGFALIDVYEASDHSADLYETLSEWRIWEDVT